MPFSIFDLHDETDEGFGLIRVKDADLQCLLKEAKEKNNLSANEIREILSLNETDSTINSWFSGTYGVPLSFIKKFGLYLGDSWSKRFQKNITTLSSGVRSGYSSAIIPSSNDPSLFYALGALVGDGSLGDKSNSYDVIFEMSDEQVISKIKRNFEKSFNITSKIRQSIRKDNRKSFILKISNKCVYRFFTNCFGLTPRKTKTVGVPSIVFDTNQKLILAFLNGLLDTDGTETPNRVRFFSSSKKLINGISLLLTNLGYSNHIYVYNRKDYGSEFQLSLDKGNSIAFLRELNTLDL